MGKLFGGILGLLVIITLAGAIAGQLTREPSFYELEQQRIRLDLLHQQAETEAFWAPVRAAALNTALIIGVFGVAMYLAALGGGQLTFFRQYAQPDARGLLPVLREDQETARDALAGHHAARIADAQRPHPPHTYAPRIDYRSDPSRVLSDAVINAPALPALPPIVDLAQLGYQPRREAILLGLGQGGELITVPAPRLCHVALVGATGGGKSNLMRLLLPQLLAIGADVVLADPHHAPVDPETGDDWRPIIDRLKLPPAVSVGKGGEIDGLLTYLTEELDRRLALRRNGQPSGGPIFLALDELPVIADGVPGAIDRLARLLREGRKVGLYSVGAAQTMLVKVLGGDSSARENFRTAFYVGGDLRSAAALLDVPQRELDESALGQGIVYLRSAATSPARLVRVPLSSNAGIAAMLGAVTGPVAGPESGPASRPIGFHTGPAAASRTRHGPASGPDGASASGRAETPLDTDDARLLAKFAAGASIHDLAVELAGTSNPGDRRYKAARARVEALLRRLTEGKV